MGGTTVRIEETPARDRSQDGGTQVQRGEEKVDSRANVRVAGALQTVIEGLRGSDGDERELDPNGDDRRHDQTSDSRLVPTDLMAGKQAAASTFDVVHPLNQSAYNIPRSHQVGPTKDQPNSVLRQPSPDFPNALYDILSSAYRAEW